MCGPPWTLGTKVSFHWRCLQGFFHQFLCRRTIERSIGGPVLGPHPSKMFGDVDLSLLSSVDDRYSSGHPSPSPLHTHTHTYPLVQLKKKARRKKKVNCLFVKLFKGQMTDCFLLISYFSCLIFNLICSLS